MTQRAAQSRMHPSAWKGYSPKSVGVEGSATWILTATEEGYTALPRGSEMDRCYKPKGYSSVSAYVVAEGAQKVIDFLIGSFDARQTRRYERPDGSIMHAEVQIDDAVVMIADGGGDNPAFPVWLHVYVPDVDASYERAL